jgi:hypothetical protein
LLRIEKVFKKENPFQGDILSMTTYFWLTISKRIDYVDMA